MTRPIRPAPEEGHDAFSEEAPSVEAPSLRVGDEDRREVEVLGVHREALVRRVEVALDEAQRGRRGARGESYGRLDEVRHGINEESG